MNLRGATIALLFSCAGPALAQELKLSSPIDCDLEKDCYIQQFVDRDPGPGATDYTCSTLSYDGHKGTDFALRDIAQMERNIKVVASASGIVRGLRDGMPDIGYSDAVAADVEGRECGNGLVIDHGDGWETQYCHLKQGSLTVTRGEQVATGDVLGEVGQSGKAAFPHVHLSVRKDGKVIDPFDPLGALACTTSNENTLWETPPPYRPGGILAVGFSDQIPEYDAIKAGVASRNDLPVDAPALVVYGFLFGTQAGDELSLDLAGPNGTIIEDIIALDRTQAQSFRAIGRRLQGASWPKGNYTGSATLMRAGKQIDQQSAALTIR